jgi:hypothetical protein
MGSRSLAAPWLKLTAKQTGECRSLTLALWAGPQTRVTNEHYRVPATKRAN